MRIIPTQNHVKFIRGLLGQGHKTRNGPAPVADLVQQYPGNHDATHDQQDHLNNICQRHRSQPAVKRISQREQPQRNQSGGEIHARDSAHRQRTQPENGSEIDQCVDTKPKNRHDGFNPLVITLGQELGHRIDTRVEKDG